MGRVARLKEARRQDRRTSAALRRWTAGNVPHVRDELVRSLGYPPVQTWMDNLMTNAPEGEVSIDATWRHMVTWLHAADLYYVTDAMSAVVESAANSLPPMIVRAEDAPSLNGLVIWGRPPVIETTGSGHAYDDTELVTRGLLWTTGMSEYGPMAVACVLVETAILFASNRFKADTGLTKQEEIDQITAITGPLSVLEVYPFPLDVNRPDLLIENRDLAALIATWRLMGQRIAVTTTERPSAAYRSRMAPGRPEPHVNSITLRRASTATPGDRADGQAPTREYHHQWVVSGHWRSQTHLGADRPPIYITEHVKGPEGAPLIGAERVAVLRR